VRELMSQLGDELGRVDANLSMARPLTLQDFISARTKCKPSVGAHAMDEHIRFAQEYGSA